MYLPTPIYERIPQFWFLLGLLFFATGLFLSFEYVLSFYYLGVGVACCMYGVSIFLIRLRHRKALRTAEQEPVTAEHASMTAEYEPVTAEHEPVSAERGSFPVE